MVKALIQILRWSPAVVILLSSAVCLGSLLVGGMAGVVGWVVFPLLIPLLGILTLLATGGYALWKRRLRGPVAVNLVVGLLALLPIGMQIGLFPIAYPASLDDTEPTARVRLPADAPLLVGWGGDTPEVNYHVTVPGQRWAYDLLVEPALVGSDSLEDYGCFGVPVLAPAAGTVVVARDGFDDMTPGAMDPQNLSGNFVAIRLPTDTYLVIAHLMKGSLAVEEGDEVAEGQPIGQCGNSGNTSEPHIHIHHQRQNPKRSRVDVAEGLPLFFRDHDGDPMPTGGLAVVDGKAVAKGSTVRHVGAR